MPNRIVYTTESANTGEFVVQLNASPSNWMDLAAELNLLNEIELAMGDNDGKRVFITINPAYELSEAEPAISSAIKKFMGWKSAEVKTR